MAEKTQRQIALEVHQGMFGVEGTEDKGLIGDIKEMSKKLDVVNGRTRRNETRSKVNQAIIGILIGGSGITAAVTKIADLW